MKHIVYYLTIILLAFILGAVFDSVIGICFFIFAIACSVAFEALYYFFNFISHH
ncbi:MAG: hypothetical protein LBN95_06060 [Prevotellaceae bacterium]|nr:hypothetical protein [Prevotellaceae bacterium]